MHEDEYALGVDIGVGGVTAVACSTGAGGPVLVPVQLTPGPAGRSARVLARIGSPVPLYEGDQGRPAAEVAADLVADARAEAEAQLGRAPAWTVVTVPPSWGAYRSDLLTEALAATGAGASLVSSALAAVYAHIDSGRLSDSATVAVYDLGAGTLDTAVVRATPGGELEQLEPAPEPLHWGGQDIDDALLAHVVRTMWNAVPGDRFDRERVRVLRADVVTAKEALSSDTVTTVAATPDAELRLTREELDELVRPGVQESVHALAAHIGAAGLPVDGIDAVVLVGGSVRVPLVGECLSAELGRPLVVDAEPELTVARGAARLALELAAGMTVPGPAVAGEAAAGEAAAGEAAAEEAAAEEAAAGEAAAAPDARGDAAPAPLVAPPTGRREAPPRLVARPPTAARTRPSGRPAGRSGPRRGARVLVVAGLILGLVLVVPTLSATLLPGAEPVAGTPVAEAQDDTAREGAPGPRALPDVEGAPRTATDVEVREAAGRRVTDPDRAARRSSSPVARVAATARAAAQRVTGAPAAPTSAGSPAAPSSAGVSAAAPSAATPSTAASSAAPSSPAGVGVAPTSEAPRTSASPAGTQAPQQSAGPAPTSSPPSPTTTGPPAPTTPPPPAAGTPAADPTPTTPAPTSPSQPTASEPPPASPEPPPPSPEPPPPSEEVPAAATETPAETTAAPVAS